MEANLVGIEGANLGYWVQNTITVFVNEEIEFFDQKLKSILLTNDEINDEIRPSNISERLKGSKGECICISGILNTTGKDDLFEPCLKLSIELQTKVILSSFDMQKDTIFYCLIDEGLVLVRNETQF
ncbi:hypothetical protein [Leptospira terpstrae]|uniref:Uncharacterized protein n=1 Tax=Leptospira terpstrae serovar Hualin str. LT 11-33 = ATCC 700639 TaxID=1257025 RepID=N1W2N2_9LEPT|nr:hypothetical protein [Leptospira terpstrae]EMY61916.1 hypothetical protein LEP1GSC203_3885 [Leptospira terpstrae serovar Hualin str. LT 11-33 = ATCC 700639]